MRLFIGFLVFAISFSARAEGGQCVNIFMTPEYASFLQIGAKTNIKTFDQYLYVTQLRNAERDYFEAFFAPKMGTELTNGADVAVFLGKLGADVTEGYVPARDIVIQIFDTFYKPENPKTLESIVQYYEFMATHGMVGPNALKFAKEVNYDFETGAERLNSEGTEFVNDIFNQSFH